MSKRNYTHIKELLPMIEAMVAEGMTQREIVVLMRPKAALALPMGELAKIGSSEPIFD